jgi:hypothetical protein
MHAYEHKWCKENYQENICMDFILVTVTSLELGS